MPAMIAYKQYANSNMFAGYTAAIIKVETAGQLPIEILKDNRHQTQILFL